MASKYPVGSLGYMEEQKRKNNPSFWRKALAVGGKVGKFAGLAASFANPALGAALVGAGSLADKADDEGGFGGTKLFKDVLLPAGATYAGGKMFGGGGGSVMPATGSQFGMQAVPQQAGMKFSGLSGAFNAAKQNIGKVGADNLLKAGGAYLQYKGDQRADETNRMLIERQIQQEEEEKERQRKRWEMFQPFISRLQADYGSYR